MMMQRTGYMSCIKNLGDPDASNWIAAGCPLPAMMGIERRKGKDKPVITKALVMLNGVMFKSYEQVRKKWAYLDAYKSPGPIQFKGFGSQLLNFMVQDPDVDRVMYEVEEQERFENKHVKDEIPLKHTSGLSVLCKGRIKAPIEMPEVF